MSNSRIQATAALSMRAGAKFVLFALSDIACNDCGLTWVGRQKLQEYTCLGHTIVSNALAELVAAGYIVVHAYPKGGRGRATEYVVHPQLATKRAPCAECVARMARPPDKVSGSKRATLAATANGVHPDARKSAPADTPEELRGVLDRIGARLGAKPTA